MSIEIQSASTPQPPYKVAIAACVGGQSQDIAEWVLYHRSIKFDHIYLYCAADDPVHLYGKLLPFLHAGPAFVTFRHFPSWGRKFHMFRHFLENRKHDTEWIAFLDVDEFFHLPGIDDIRQYLSACPPAWDAIHVNRSRFGHGGHAEPTTDSVLTGYTRRAAKLDPITKTLTRTARIDVARIDGNQHFWHDWGDLLLPGSTAVNVLGSPMGEVIGQDHGKTYLASAEIQQRIRGTAVVNRYATKSASDARKRSDRGVAADPSGPQPLPTDDGHASRMAADPDTVEDGYLADYWRRLLGRAEAASLVPRETLANVALDKAAQQSSIGAWSRGATPEEDAAGAVSGKITGDFQFQTDAEDAPWWSVDLGAPHVLAEIRVFNRLYPLQARRRLGRFSISVSPDGGEWQPLYTHDGSIVGGADGNPLIVRLNEPMRGRHLRIAALQPTILHLDQVAIYGAALPPLPQIPPGVGSAQAATQNQQSVAALDGLIAMLGARLGLPVTPAVTPADMSPAAAGQGEATTD